MAGRVDWSEVAFVVGPALGERNDMVHLIRRRMCPTAPATDAHVASQHPPKTVPHTGQTGYHGAGSPMESGIWL